MLLGVLGLMALPSFQYVLHPFHEPEIGGAIMDATKPVFSRKAIVDGSYQDSLAEYFKDRVGFRSFFVRVHNDIQYRFFAVIPTQDLVEGKEGYLFERGYMDGYQGRDFLGINTITKRLEKVKFLQDTLSAKGIDLILVYAPNKARIYADMLPGARVAPVNKSNYEVYLEQSKKLDLRFIDINGWFLSARDTSRYPLISKLGTHWNSYGMTLAMDSIARYIEVLRGIDLPEILIDTVYLKYSNHALEYDLASLLNLLFPLPQPRSPIPECRYDIIGKDRPKTLAIADSYYWFVYFDTIAHALFSKPEYWYYFKSLYRTGSDKIPSDQVDLISEIEQHEIVIMLGTEFNLFNFGWGFIDQAYHAYKGIPYQKSFDLKRVLEVETLIKGNPDWLEQVELKAIRRRISLDSMIRIDAIYMVEREAIFEGKE